MSCYLCPKFIAWEDGPHAQLLADVKNMVADSEKTVSSGDRIPYQLNELIQAIEELLRKIQAKK